MATRKNITDRALRYRAQKNVRGPKKCLLCGAREGKGAKRPGLDVMHLDGNESNGERNNLAWGCRSCNQKLAAAFKKLKLGRLTNQYNPASGRVPTYAQYAWAVAQQQHSGDHGDAGAIIHATPLEVRSQYAKRIARSRASKAFDRWNPGKGAFERCVKSVSAKGSAYSPRGVCATAGREKYGKKKFAAMAAAGRRRARRGNPADAAAEAFEEFHGFAPREVVKVEEKRHYHKHLPAAGELVGLEVYPIDGKKMRRIEGLDDALLTFNEAKNQLFVTGGDQSMSWSELKKFGIRDEHELHTLGKLRAVGYFTDKTHLGSEGGEAIYSHVFRTTNELGRHITVTIARYPDLIYRVLDERFEISGGSYKIRAEGIDL